MKISLNKEGVEGINILLGKMNTLKENIIIAGQESVEELVFKGATKASVLNSSAPQTGVEKSIVSGDSDRTDNGADGIISLSGPNSIYDEFGIGEEGADDPHPQKSEFSFLNPYNSGPVVSTHISKNGRHYWFYNPMKGKPYFDSKTGYTEGVPSGKQMFNTSLYINEIKDEIVKEKINNAMKFFK